MQVTLVVNSMARLNFNPTSLMGIILVSVITWQCETDVCLSLLSLLGVEFTLPLASDSHPKAEEPSDTLEDSEHEDESAASTWLCSMGIGTQDFPAADTQKIALYPPHLNMPESLCC